MSAVVPIEQAGGAGATFGPLSIPSSIRAPAEIEPALIGGVVGNYAKAIADATQTAPTMAALVALAVLATCCQRKLEVQPYQDSPWHETTSFWSLILAESGERKSAVIAPLVEPLQLWERAQRDRFRVVIAQNLAAREAAKARIERLKLDAAKAKTADERAAAQRAIAEELANTPEPIFAPRSFVTDVTSERLQQLLAENDERISLFSDEPGQFATIGGLYTSGHANFDVFLKGADGGSVSVQRQGRQAYVARAALTVCLAVQPGLFVEIAADRRMRHSGLLARFAYGAPASRVGRRDPTRRGEVDAELVSAYRAQVLRLMDHLADGASAARVVTLSAEAQAVFDAWRGALEDELATGGRLRGLRDWGAKHAGRTLRIAALLELARNGPEIERVGGAAMIDAVEIAGKLVDHALAAFAAAGADEAEADARYLLEWLRARGEPFVFSSAEALKACESRFRRVERLRAAAAVLTGWGVLSEPQQRRNHRARSSTIWLVNPEAMEERA
jgi:hypothetical protein